MAKTKFIKASEKLDSIRDLSDFCEAWPDLRFILMIDLKENPELIETYQKALNWLILLADKTFAPDPD